MSDPDTPPAPPALPSEPPASPKSSKRPKTKRQTSHRSTLSMQRTEIRINVYDLLPPGRISSFLWLIGGSLLHSGVVLNSREYAYGGHDRPNLSGVYWTRPRLEPPGGTFKLSILHGFSLLSPTEVDAVVREASERFTGTAYNLLTNNCNHFTSYLCERLTGKPAPAWLNRAASIGVALPCVVPREWISPPEVGQGGDEEEEEEDERAAMLGSDRRRRERDEGQLLVEDGHDEPGSVGGTVTDTSGREMPPAERAPVPAGR